MRYYIIREIIYVYTKYIHICINMYEKYEQFLLARALSYFKQKFPRVCVIILLEKHYMFTKYIIIKRKYIYILHTYVCTYMFFIY